MGIWFEVSTMPKGLNGSPVHKCIKTKGWECDKAIKKNEREAHTFPSERVEGKTLDAWTSPFPEDKGWKEMLKERICVMSLEWNQGSAEGAHNFNWAEKMLECGRVPICLQQRIPEKLVNDVLLATDPSVFHCTDTAAFVGRSYQLYLAV